MTTFVQDMARLKALGGITRQGALYAMDSWVRDDRDEAPMDVVILKRISRHRMRHKFQQYEGATPDSVWCCFLGEGGRWHYGETPQAALQAAFSAMACLKKDSAQ